MPIPINRVPDPDLAAAWSRTLGHASSLFQALDQLDELGGAARAVASGGWSVAAVDRALGTLMATREALDTEVIRLEQRRKHYPRPGRLG
jgi:hypothetical protein